jgi:hypothetical protein
MCREYRGGWGKRLAEHPFSGHSSEISRDLAMTSSRHVGHDVFSKDLA